MSVRGERKLFREYEQAGNEGRYYRDFTGWLVAEVLALRKELSR